MIDFSSKAPTALVVVDMQTKFLNNLDKQGVTRREVRHAILRALQFGWTIFVVTSEGWGPLDPAIAALLAKCDKCVPISKTDGDGSEGILAWCNLPGNKMDIFRLCGVSADTCVYRLARGLSVGASWAQVQIAVQACNPSTSNWSGFYAGALERARLVGPWGRELSQAPRLIDGTTLGLVDLQDEFLAGCADPKGILDAGCQEIQNARSAGNGVVILYFPDKGTVNSRISDAIKGYDRAHLVPKTEDDGSVDLIETCLTFGLGTTQFRMGGIFAEDCLFVTVAATAAFYPVSRIEVVAAAGNFYGPIIGLYKNLMAPNVHLIERKAAGFQVPSKY